MRFASESIVIVAPVFGAALVLLLWGVLGGRGGAIYGGLVVAVVALGLLAFFRDPVRRAPAGEGWVVSPADGKVMTTETLPDGRKHISIFLSVFDVHVNRAPVTATVEAVTAVPGSYFHAGSVNAEGNARVDVSAESDNGAVAWRQVSGLLARKISCKLKRGDRVAIGQKFGLIYFGSRMDVYLPPSAVFRTEPGKRVRAGESVIAQFPEKDVR